MNDDIKPELAKKPEWLASFHGFPIYVDPGMAPGWVKFLDEDGNIIGMISDVGAIYLAEKRSP